jgi:hypothetical protein
MLYFIRIQTQGEKALGPLGSIEALNKARQLRDEGVAFVLANEDGVLLVSSDQLSRSDDQPRL